MEAGVNIHDFWDYTLAELMVIIKSNRRKMVINNYQLAQLISSFIACSFNGKEPDSVFEMFPDVFTDEQIEQQRQAEAEAYYASFVAFAQKRKQLQELEDLQNNGH